MSRVVRRRSGARAAFLSLWREILRRSSRSRPPGRCAIIIRRICSGCRTAKALRGSASSISRIACSAARPMILSRLLQDARVDIADDLELRLLAHYARRRASADPAFDTSAFARAYAVIGAQRATKILGIFARLDKRDRKPHYLAHLPRIEPICARVWRIRCCGAQGLVSEPSAGDLGPTPRRRRFGVPMPAKHESRHAEARHGVRRRPRHAHAPDHRHLPKPLVEVGGQAADRSLPRPIRGRRRRARRSSMFTISPIRSKRISRRAGTEDRHFRRARAAARPGRRHQRALPLLGDEPFFLCNTDAFWIEGPRSNLAAPRGRLGSRAMDVAASRRGRRDGAVGVEGPGDFTMDARGRLKQREEPRRRALRLFGRRHHQAAALRRARRRMCSGSRRSFLRPATGRLYGVRLDGLWLHVGRPRRSPRRSARSIVRRFEGPCFSGPSQPTRRQVPSGGWRGPS